LLQPAAQLLRGGFRLCLEFCQTCSGQRSVAHFGGILDGEEDFRERLKTEQQGQTLERMRGAFQFGPLGDGMEPVERAEQLSGDDAAFWGGSAPRS